MDFFASQDAARRKTAVLVFYFAMAVLLIVLGIYAIFTAVFIGMPSGSQPGGGPASPVSLWSAERFAAVAGITILIVVLGSLYKIALLRGDGSRVAEMLGGRLVPPNTADFEERRLLNVVEEMALASGVPVPPVYILDREEGINAFAAGYTPDNAVVAVTRGCLHRLNRDELQGVIAHEFSHILNGDMRLNVRLIGILHGILVISLIGYLILRSVQVGSYGRRRNRDDKGTAAIALFGLGLIVIGWAGVFFGRLIKSAVSRQREYLADASAVQFTRNPLGIANALKKIGAFSLGSRIRTPRAEEASHMFFGNGLKSSWFGFMATHPPLVDRIRRLDPGFDGTFPKIAEGEREQPPPVPRPPSKRAAAGPPPPSRGRVGRIPLPGMESIPGPILLALAASPEKILEAVGMPASHHLEHARKLLASIPDSLKDAAREGYGARAVVYALLLDRNEEIRSRQVARLRENADPVVYEETLKIASDVASVPVEARLPLLDLAMTGLRSLSREQYLDFRGNLDALIEADEKISLFEYALRRIVTRHLDAFFRDRPARTAQIYSVKGLTGEISCVLSMLAHLGADDEEAARKAFAGAAQRFGDSSASLSFRPASECDLAAVDRALDRLATASGKIKKILVVAAFQCLAADQRITVDETELFRAIAASLDLPVSPLLAMPTPAPEKLGDA